MADIAKLEAVLDYIRTHPEEHHQSLWGRKTACGTAFCFAGITAALAGYQFIWLRDGLGGWETYECRVNDDHPDGVLVDGKPRASVSSIAQRELDLTEDQAFTLFLGHNTFDELEQLVKQYANTQEAR